MNRLLLSFLFLFALNGFSGAQDSSKRNFTGVYQWCLVRCETIKIDNDFTFEFLFERKDLYKGSLSGTWRIVEKNKIRLIAKDQNRIDSFKKMEEEDGMTIDPAYPTEIDDVFIRRKKKLCMLFNGGIYACYKKLDRKQSQRLIPPK